MRLLFARVGRTFCRKCGQEVIRETAEVVATQLACAARRHAAAARIRSAGRRSPIAGGEPATDDAKTTRRGEAELGRSKRESPSAQWRSRTCAARASAGCWSTARPWRSTRSIRRARRRRRCCGWSSIASGRGDARAADRFDRDRVSGRRRRRVGDGACPTREGDRRTRRISSPNASSAAAAASLRGSAAAAVLVQQPVRRVPDLPRLRQHHRARHGSGGARSVEVDQPGRDRAVEQAALPLAARRAEARREDAAACGSTCRGRI